MTTTTGNNHDQWHSGETWNAAHTSSVQWTVPVRYQNLTYIGQGAFGAVLRATDTKTHKPVAIKKLFRPFFSGTHAKRTYRELRLLQHLNHPDAQVIQLYNVFTPEKTLKEFQTLYFVFNFVDFDLHRVIARRDPFTEDHIQQIVYSILRGLKFIHSAKIIHRDLTPRNVGISQTSDVTILDFGLARVASDGLQTGYVVARWWRAPEVMVNWEQYNNKLDVWSVGCIMAQLVRLSPLFPGTDYPDQVRRIIGVTGTPTEQELNELCQEEARFFILNEVPNVPPADFHELFPTLSEDGIDLLKRFLRFDPRQRPTVEEALAHPFLASYHDPAAEPTAAPIEGLHEDAAYSIEKWKEMTWQLIQSFHEPAWALEPAAQETP